LFGPVRTEAGEMLGSIVENDRYYIPIIDSRLISHKHRY
jgi:hypothetical protein